MVIVNSKFNSVSFSNTTREQQWKIIFIHWNYWELGESLQNFKIILKMLTNTIPMGQRILEFAYPWNHLTNRVINYQSFTPSATNHPIENNLLAKKLKNKLLIYPIYWLSFRQNKWQIFGFYRKIASFWEDILKEFISISFGHKLFVLILFVC